MIRNWQLAGTVAFGIVAASAAQAEEHAVVVTGFSYFPAVVYAEPGDTIRFINESGEEQTVVGKDAGWTVGPLADMEEGTLTVDQETELAFYSAYAEFVDMNGDGVSDPGSETDYGSYENAPIKAEITFLEPPLSEG
jgi:plastocyanin